jgi:hypothetical protein
MQKDLVGKHPDSITNKQRMELKLAKLDFIRKSRPIGAEKYQEHKKFVKVTTKQCHRGWVTKIKYYSDM